MHNEIIEYTMIHSAIKELDTRTIVVEYKKNNEGYKMVILVFLTLI